MIRIENIQNIKNRIAEIEQQFGVNNLSRGQQFGQILAEKMKAKTAEINAAADITGVNAVNQTGKAAATAASTAPEGQVIRTMADLPTGDANLEQMIDAAAKKYHVDPKLVSAVAEVESGGNQSAISPVGAIGVMQLMPDTAASLGVDPFDKQQNIEGGAKYLRQMLDTFGGDMKKAIAAYNAGPGAVKDYGGVPPYSETQNYVSKVLDIYR
ncbi:MAG: lytic transglycosylase domain-containing protein [Selenomonadaceae bacterium]|nr:lytic transglycosylase domain-containing protein [Selenomonadaceae bacterium]